MSNKIVLAYSGGLDTSYCAQYLVHEKQMEVHAVTVNTGGFSPEEIKDIEEKAYQMGVASYTCIEAKQIFYDKVVKYLIYGNVLKNNTYPLSVSAERVVQSIEIVNKAIELGTNQIAHGSTGAGNDQVRFDLIFQVLLPNVNIITPIRDLQLTRQEEIDYLVKNGVDLSWDKAKYSINQGLWGTSVGGAETLTSHQNLPEDAFPSQLDSDASKTLELTFEKGELTAIDGKKANPVDNILALEKLASSFAIGRDIHVGDTIIGIKGRVGFEAAAPSIILKAHHTLEKHTLTKWQLHHKENIASNYGMLLHEGQYLDPVMRDFESYLESSQAHVNGVVSVTLHPYRFVVNGIQSEQDLMQSSFGNYGEENNQWTAEEVKGFIKIMSNQSKLYHNTKIKN